MGRGMADFISFIYYLRACLCRTVVHVWDDEVTQGVIDPALPSRSLQSEGRGGYVFRH